MNIEEIRKNTSTVASFASEYFKYLAHVLSQIDIGEIEKFVQILVDARDRDARVFFLGNGGSAATATHFANDLAIGVGNSNKPFKAISLADNVAAITAAGNDYGYDEIFMRQLKAQMVKGDVVVAISVSGNSPNVMKAVEWANANGGITIGLTGFDGGRLRRTASHCVHVPTEKGEYGPAEDAHMVLDHLLYSYLLKRA